MDGLSRRVANTPISAYQPHTRQAATTCWRTTEHKKADWVEDILWRSARGKIKTETTASVWRGAAKILRKVSCTAALLPPWFQMSRSPFYSLHQQSRADDRRLERGGEGEGGRRREKEGERPGHVLRELGIVFSAPDTSEDTQPWRHEGTTHIHNLACW